MTCSIIWDGISVSISHTPNWLNSEFYHIEQRAGERLRVTNAGHRQSALKPFTLARIENPSPKRTFTASC